LYGLEHDTILHTMKRKIGFALLLVSLIFALALAGCNQPAMSSRNLSGAALSMQVPPAPPVGDEDKSEIGSTDGILIMGVIIVAITSLPVIFRRKKK